MSIQSVIGLFIVVVGATFSSAAGPVTETQPRGTEPQLAPPLTFNVWLDGRKMGQQRYSFEAADDLLIVTSKANFNVKVLFVSVFDYDHKAIERWQGNCLQTVKSTTTTNGKEQSLNLKPPAKDCAGTYAYWDKQRLQRPELTNAQTGKSEPAQWLDRGLLSLPRVGKRKMVRPDPGLVSAIELTTTSAQFQLFYDSTDQLLMMQTINDGRTVTFLHDSLDVK